MVDVDQGRLRYTPARTFTDLAGEWLEVVGANRKASTLANYQMLVNAYLVPRIGLRRIDRVNPAVIQRLYAELRSSGGRGGRPLSGSRGPEHPSRPSQHLQLRPADGLSGYQPG
jgi:hypothetical protein